MRLARVPKALSQSGEDSAILPAWVAHFPWFARPNMPGRPAWSREQVPRIVDRTEAQQNTQKALDHARRRNRCRDRYPEPRDHLPCSRGRRGFGKAVTLASPGFARKRVPRSEVDSRPDRRFEGRRREDRKDGDRTRRRARLPVSHTCRKTCGLRDLSGRSFDTGPSSVEPPQPAMRELSPGLAPEPATGMCRRHPRVWSFPFPVHAKARVRLALAFPADF